MKTFFFSIALLAGVAIQPPIAQLIWYEGEATLSTGITLRGELCYQPEANVLLFRSAGKWHTYPASQLRGFHFVNLETSVRQNFTVFDVAQNGQEDAMPLIFEELIIGVPIKLLQLDGNRAVLVARKYKLPRQRTQRWQTPQPWYIWLDGRFVALDDFVETELDTLLQAAPWSVQHWAAESPRPANPKQLARWLGRYQSRMGTARPENEHRLTTSRYP